MSDAFDIGTLRAADTDELVINHPVTGEPTQWVWTIAGPAHPVSVEQANRLARENARVQRLQAQAVVNRKKWHEPERSTEQVRDDNARMFAARVLGWTPAKINGADYPFNTENVVRLLLDPAFGSIWAQLMEFYNSETAFMRASETTS